MLQPDPVPQPLDHILAKGDAHAPALVLRSGTLDYQTLDALVGRAAAGLRARGLVPGDRVAAWLAKTRLACIMPLAAARAGLIYVPLNPLLKRAQISHIMTDCGARLLITNESRAATLQGGDVDCPVEGDEDAIFADDALPPSSADPSDVVEILYTSGSTGRPKGVVLSHANLWLGAISVSHYLKLGPADRTLCVLPFSFDYGQNQLFSTWAAGGAAIPLDYLTPRDVIKAIEKHGVTTLAGVPPLWVQLAETPWPEGVPQLLRRLTNSGGAVPVRAGLSLVKDARKVGRLGAGLTEWAGRSARGVVDAPVLRQAVAEASLAHPVQTVSAVKAAFKAEKAGALVRLAKDVGRVSEKAGTKGALDVLRIADGPQDVARAARLADVKGGRTRAVIKLLGRGALLLTAGLFNLAWWVFAAILLVFGFLSSIKSTTESLTRWWLARRKRRRAARLAALAAPAVPR